MCRFKPGEAVLCGGILEILTCDDTDSHTEIRERHNIREDRGGTGLGDRYHTPVEFIPVRNIFRRDGYDFVFAAGKPDWWTDGHTQTAIRQLWTAAKQCLNIKTKTFTGTQRHLDLSSLTDAKGLTLPQTCCHLYYKGIWRTSTEMQKLV